MLPLDDLDQALSLQPPQMRAGGRRRHAGENREFRAGARTSVQEAIERPGTRRLADRRRDRRDRQVEVGNIQYSMLIEV
jgi:hypothetical protein